MRISRITLTTLQLPFIEPFVISYARWEAMPSVIVRVETDDGLVGWGEAVPDESVTGENYRAALSILEHQLAPLALDLEPTALEELHRRMDAVIYGNTAAKAALDLACHDLIGKRAGMAYWQLHGGRAQDDLALPSVVSIDEPEQMARRAEELLAAGFEDIKVKAGLGDPDLDVRRIRAVAEAVAGRAPVRVDVNQGWHSPAIAIPAARQLEDLGLLWLEQPIRMGDIAGLAEIRRAVRIPIMADETCQDHQSVLEIIRQRAADYINIKLMKTSGLHRALGMVATAEAAGLGVQIGSMVESSVASAAGMQLATARRAIVSTELTGPALFSRDVGDLKLSPPRVAIGDAPGLGVAVDSDALDDLTEMRVEIS